MMMVLHRISSILLAIVVIIVAVSASPAIPRSPSSFTVNNNDNNAQTANTRSVSMPNLMRHNNALNNDDSDDNNDNATNDINIITENDTIQLLEFPCAEYSTSTTHNQLLKHVIDVQLPIISKQELECWTDVFNHMESYPFITSVFIRGNSLTENNKLNATAQDYARFMDALAVGLTMDSSPIIDLYVDVFKLGHVDDELEDRRSIWETFFAVLGGVKRSQVLAIPSSSASSFSSDAHSSRSSSSSSSSSPTAMNSYEQELQQRRRERALTRLRSSSLRMIESSSPHKPVTKIRSLTLALHDNASFSEDVVMIGLKPLLARSQHLSRLHLIPHHHNILTNLRDFASDVLTRSRSLKSLVWDLRSYPYQTFVTPNALRTMTDFVTQAILQTYQIRSYEAYAPPALHEALSPVFTSLCWEDVLEHFSVSWSAISKETSFMLQNCLRYRPEPLKTFKLVWDNSIESKKLAKKLYEPVLIEEYRTRKTALESIILELGKFVNRFPNSLESLDVVVVDPFNIGLLNAVGEIISRSRSSLKSFTFGVLPFIGSEVNERKMESMRRVESVFNEFVNAVLVNGVLKLRTLGLVGYVPSASFWETLSNGIESMSSLQELKLLTMSGNETEGIPPSDTFWRRVAFQRNLEKVVVEEVLKPVNTTELRLVRDVEIVGV